MNTKLTRIQDYEFLGLYEPENLDSDTFFYVYDVLMMDGAKGRCFYSSIYNNVLMKGDVIEYYEREDKKLVVYPPKRNKWNFGNER